MSPEAHRQSYGGAVVDSSTSALAGGVAGTFNLQDPNGINRQWTDFRLGFGYALGDRFAAGGTLRYLRAQQDVDRGPLGTSYVSDGTPGSPLLNTITFDIGATVIPVDGFKIGAVGHNLTNPGARLAPTTVQGGSATAPICFRSRGTSSATSRPTAARAFGAMLGGELFLGGHVPIRLGYRYDDGLKTHAISGGLGYVEKSWSFEVGARHDVAGDHPATMLVASIRFFYNPDGGSGGVDTSNSAF